MRGTRARGAWIRLRNVGLERSILPGFDTVPDAKDFSPAAPINDNCPAENCRICVLAAHCRMI